MASTSKKASSQNVAANASVFLRIRPFAEGGYHGKDHKDAIGIQLGADKKRIQKFDDNTITIHDDGSSKSHHFDYLKRIIGPTDDQVTAFKKANVPELMTSFLNGHHVAIIAFGQTGSGKTHTMFGPPTLAKEIAQTGAVNLHAKTGFPEEWGIFARAILTAMSLMLEKSEKEGAGVAYTFTASVIELYMMQIFDLLNNKEKLHTPKFSGGDFDFDGVTEWVIKTPEDVAKIANIVMNMRTARGTSVNDSSSRSHCIATLNLSEVRVSGGKKEVRKSSFTFADLSGSERVSKTGFEKAQTEGMEGIGINYELFMMGVTLDRIADSQHKKSKLTANHDSILCRVLANSIDGRAISSMIVCCSQSDNCGGETWCSLQFGQRMARLRQQNPPVQPWNGVDKLLKVKRKEMNEQKSAVDRLEAMGAGGKQNKFYTIRKARLGQLQNDIAFLESC